MLLYNGLMGVVVSSVELCLRYNVYIGVFLVQCVHWCILGTMCTLVYFGYNVYMGVFWGYGLDPIFPLTGREMSTHKKTWSTHKYFFKKCVCTYFIHGVLNIDKWW